MDEERASASDRKRKIKSYVESLDVEKARLERTLNEATTILSESPVNTASVTRRREKERNTF